MNILAGFDAPDAGTVTLEGRPCGGPGPDRAVVFQEPALFPWLTALENVEIGLEAAGIPSAARRARALDMLALTGLSGRENQIPAELSETAGFSRSGIGPVAARTAYGRTVRRAGRHHA